MEPFAQVLAAGGHTNALGRAGEVLAHLRTDDARTGELFACIADDDAWVRMRAVDTFEKLVREDPDRGVPYIHRVLTELTGSDQPSVQWHVAQLLGELPLTASRRATAVAWLRERLTSTDVDWIVAAQSMATLVGFVRAGLLERARVVPLLEVQTGHRSASVRRKAAGHLAELGG
ncbi:hypothetical protein H9L10_00860 [Phycicoccus endophyticus]|uniref:HEAT repeat domain-containing protein n=1 Tax=Phycicoccus endophyticus TaxID=1690220 RepID=A0A7G9R275_9MICO|nr:hypothetical protein [Phycicoccus endophyticus]NHI19646.1 hypothetical protein [Phycicoccus endophyticus]QNN49700.1 hypothetical protein H9L10_00860 [Phycicoccus endophyticus]GGL34240.1 hypothetical protein GCM10012283_15820 [Phycicoccus endophyticus]